MQSFVVRIYRQSQSRYGPVVGVVEDIRKRRQAAFHGMQELWAILSGHKCYREKPGRNRSTKR